MISSFKLHGPEPTKSKKAIQLEIYTVNPLYVSTFFMIKKTFNAMDKSKGQKINQLSQNALRANVEWLLNSDIKIKTGIDKGALYGWKYLDPPSYPFVYSEITGYAISCYSWIYSELRQEKALEAAKQAAEWVIRKMDSEHLLVAGYRRLDTFTEKGDLSNQIYLFDNGMGMNGLLNLFRLTGNEKYLTEARNMADSLVKHFFKNSTFNVALIDKLHRPKRVLNSKWSAAAGPHHSKLSFGLLTLSKYDDNPIYKKFSDSVCEYAISLQNSDGSFATIFNSNIIQMHPHLYACEGLVYSGIFLSSEEYFRAGLRGIIWAVHQFNDKGVLTKDNSKSSTEQSDIISQLLRLVILCHSHLLKFFDRSTLTDTIDNLHERILTYCILSNDVNRGGIKYQPNLASTCSWCTMFCMQALWLWWKKTNGKLKKDERWIDYFV